MGWRHTNNSRHWASYSFQHSRIWVTVEICFTEGDFLWIYFTSLKLEFVGNCMIIGSAFVEIILSWLLVRMDESADARRILTAVPQSEWRRPVGRPYSSWMATLKNDLARHNLTLEDAIELALDKPLWRLLAASGATQWWCMPNNDDDDDDYCA